MSKFRRRENESDRGGARRTSTDRFYFDDCVRRFEKLSALLGGRERGSGGAGVQGRKRGRGGVFTSRLSGLWIGWCSRWGERACKWNG